MHLGTAFSGQKPERLYTKMKKWKLTGSLAGSRNKGLHPTKEKHQLLTARWEDSTRNAEKRARRSWMVPATLLTKRYRGYSLKRQAKPWVITSSVVTAWATHNASGSSWIPAVDTWAPPQPASAAGTTAQRPHVKTKPSAPHPGPRPTEISHKSSPRISLNTQSHKSSAARQKS